MERSGGRRRGQGGIPDSGGARRQGAAVRSGLPGAGNAIIRSSLTSFGPQCLSWREASGASPLSPRGRRSAWEEMSASSLRHVRPELLCMVGPPVAPDGVRTDGFCRTDCGRSAGPGGRWWPEPDVAGRRAGPRTVRPGYGRVYSDWPPNGGMSWTLPRGLAPPDLLAFGW